MSVNTQTSRAQYQFNPFHLVEPSPWPILTSFALLLLTMASAMYFHGFSDFTLVSIGLLAVLGVMLLWFRDISAEGTIMGNHTFQVQRGLTLGFYLFVLSEVMVFFGVFWAYFHSALAPTVELGAMWPPLGIDALSPFEVPLLNTFLLLSSGASITYAHHAMMSGNRTGTVWGFIITIILAILFTCLQGLEYWVAPFTMSDSVYGTIFFSSTGLHGLHVIVGTLFIISALARIVQYYGTIESSINTSVAIFYWHFVDVVWLFLYISVYWWGA